MTMLVFTALVAPGEPGGYQASFPDIADCTAEGADLAELLVNARRALLARLEAIGDAGEAWPAPTPIERIDAPADVLRFRSTSPSMIRRSA